MNNIKNLIILQPPVISSKQEIILEEPEQKIDADVNICTYQEIATENQNK